VILLNGLADMKNLCLNESIVEDTKTRLICDWTDPYSKIICLINAFFNIDMKKDFIVSKIEAPQDGSHYLLVAFMDPNAPKSAGVGGSGEAVPFTSPEDLMKNLPKVMSDTFGKSVGGGLLGDSPTFKIPMKEYQDMAIKVGDKVIIEIKKAGNSGV
jgi:hypothetical protein